jgi:type IV secretion system protein VirD4
MFSGNGLIIGRTLSGYLIRIPNFCHTLLVGKTGSGKGVGIIIPNLLRYRRGSIIVFDCKGDLYATTARHRSRMGKVLRLSPFGKGGYRWNPLDTIKEGPFLIDHARAMANALVVRPLGGSREPHWDDYAVIVITAVSVFVLLCLPKNERNLNSVQDIISDYRVLYAISGRLREVGGIPARLSGQIHGLFDKEGFLTKEGSGVMSTVSRHLDFLNSESVAVSVSESTFDLPEAFEPGNSLFLQIPENQLEAQKGLLRLWISTLIREIGGSWSESKGEILMMIDEASALGEGLAGIEEALVSSPLK